MSFTKLFFNRVLNGFSQIQSTGWPAIRETWSHAASGYAGEPSLTIFKKQTRLVFTAFIHSKVFMEWLQTLKTPELSLYARLNSRLVLKPLRVYMSCKWGVDRKIKILTDTYNVISLSGVRLLNALIKPEGVCLANIANTNGQEKDIQVLLRHDNTFRKEGELVVSLWSTTIGGPVVSLVFSFERTNACEIAMYIACIQGRSGFDNKILSKEMHGIWPKAVIVFIAQEIARSLNIKYIYGVGNAIHSHKMKHFIYLSSRHELSFDYDSLWMDLGGKLLSDGWFDMPLQLERRSYESMKSNKRSMYTRRYQMLDSISEQIKSALLPS